MYQCPYCENTFESSMDIVKQGNKKSCGCVSSRLKGDFHKTHGLKNHKLYKVWVAMKQRCTNPKDKGYKNYGNRGIEICNDWLNDFKSFYDWAMDNGYKEGLTIDRVNNDGNYEADNCRWTTYHVQNCNKRYPRQNKYIGVLKQGNIFVAKISIDNKSVHLGCFKTELEGALARDNYILANKLKHKLNIKGN